MREFYSMFFFYAVIFTLTYQRATAIALMSSIGLSQDCSNPRGFVPLEWRTVRDNHDSLPPRQLH